MIPLNRAKYRPRRELSEGLKPSISHSLANAPLQQRESLVDEICDALMTEMGTIRAMTPQPKRHQAA